MYCLALAFFILFHCVLLYDFNDNNNNNNFGVFASYYTETLPYANFRDLAKLTKFAK